MSAPVREGEVLAGKYRVERVLGEGGMGIVVAATHLQLEQRVALKFLLEEALASEEIVHRFRREARAAARIKTEHVARVIDVGELASGAPFMVMEYLEGKDLEDIVNERGPLPVSEAVSYVMQALEAVAEAHAAGIVHRDLKPANLFLARRPDKTAIVKVLDFGISKSLDPTTGALTSTSSILGSPHYMSPEQLSSSKRVDQRTDIWALGTILYQLLTARLAYPGDSMPQIVAAILQNDPEPLSKVRRDVPEALARAVHRCLETETKARFANVGELALALAPFVADAEGHASADSVARLSGTAAHAATFRPPASSAEGATETPRAGAATLLSSSEASSEASSAPSSGPYSSPSSTEPSAEAAPGAGKATAWSAGHATGPKTAVAQSMDARAESPSSSSRSRAVIAVLGVLGGGALAFTLARSTPTTTAGARTAENAPASASPEAPVPSVLAAPPASASASVVTTPSPSAAVALSSASPSSSTPAPVRVGTAAPPARTETRTEPKKPPAPPAASSDKGRLFMELK
ncbi:MAG: serine/threonine protein kinase [Myxococcales bacterium]|nr:serine/threonine protein kinase [Myxococcales bacterium]